MLRYDIKYFSMYSALAKMKKKLEDFVIFGSMGDIKNFHQRIFVAYVENGIENGTITRLTFALLFRLVCTANLWLQT